MIEFDKSVKADNFIISFKLLTYYDSIEIANFIKERGGISYVSHGFFIITGTSPILIETINYINNNHSKVFELCDLMGERLGSRDEVIYELTRKNRNLQLKELI